MSNNNYHEITITWTWRDVKTLHPDWSEDKCKSYLMKVSKTLEDRSTLMEVSNSLLEAIEWAWGPFHEDDHEG